jgi:ribosome-associated heat shock protein Hsp15
MTADRAGQSPAAAQAAQRIDKWLWAARFFKTRSIATNACSAGHVKCNGQSAKPSRQVRPGDRLEIVTPAGRRLVDVCALREQRGPAPVARALYEDHTPAEWLEQPKDPLDLRDRGAGRPTKRDRRDLGRLRGWS